MSSKVKIHQGKLKRRKKYDFGHTSSSPEENYSSKLLSDPSYKQKSVYVPDDIKASIDKWAKDMGLKKESKMEHLRKFVREFLREQEEKKPSDSEEIAANLLKNGKMTNLSAPKTLIHRTTNMSLSINDLEPLAVRQTRQSKRGGAPKVGLYTYSEENDVPRYGDNKIEIIIPSGTKVLDITELGRGASSRISLETAQKLLQEGVDVVVGLDYIGPPEWIILKIPPQPKQK